MSDRLFIGGPPDCGKTTVARILALTWTLALYEYDRTDVAHHLKLATRHVRHREFMAQSLEERWVRPSPDELFQRSLQSFRDRFPIVREDLHGLAARGRPVLAEGFGLLPELVLPELDDPLRAVFLLPTEGFKRRSWKIRNKPSWAPQVSDPERGADNQFQRDLLLSDEIARQARELGAAVWLIDGTESSEQVASRLTERWRAFLRA